MFCVYLVIAFEELLLSESHTTSISNTVDDGEYDNNSYMCLTQESEKYERYARDEESKIRYNLESYLLSKARCRLLETESRYGYECEYSVSPMVCHTIEEVYEERCGKCIPESEYQYHTDSPVEYQVYRL